MYVKILYTMTHIKSWFTFLHTYSLNPSSLPLFTTKQQLRKVRRWKHQSFQSYSSHYLILSLVIFIFWNFHIFFSYGHITSLKKLGFVCIVSFLAGRSSTGQRSALRLQLSTTNQPPAAAAATAQGTTSHVFTTQCRYYTKTYSI